MDLKDATRSGGSRRPRSISSLRAEIEGANARHEHEWVVWQDTKLPDGKIIIPGVIDSTSNFVEHPELVADRILQYAYAVGEENVIAGVDCGEVGDIGELEAAGSIVDLHAGAGAG